MQIVRSSEELAKARAALSGTLALVPTMGALHAGHLALIDEAKRRADRVAATIFVNPAQFGPNEDLSRYPRREEEDARLLQEQGCDLLWVPRVEDIYPAQFATNVIVRGVSDRWEGEARPGHFDGVATVVAKLLLSVRPNVALFGEKEQSLPRRMLRFEAFRGGTTVPGVTGPSLARMKIASPPNRRSLSSIRLSLLLWSIPTACESYVCQPVRA